jgi:hypothetical protein
MALSISPRRFLTASRLSCRSSTGSGFSGQQLHGRRLHGRLGFTGSGFPWAVQFPGQRLPWRRFPGRRLSGRRLHGQRLHEQLPPGRLLLLTSRGSLHCGILPFSFLPGRFQLSAAWRACLLIGKLLAFDLCLGCS